MLGGQHGILQFVQVVGPFVGSGAIVEWLVRLACVRLSMYK